MTTTPYPASESPAAALRLRQAAAQAAAVRAHHRDPDVVAWRVERVRVVVDRLIWTGMVAGLLFTMTNVQQFAAAGAPAGSVRWCIAWLLDPTVSLVLIGVLFAERLTSREQIPPGPWTRCGKWALLGATYLMNTWASWQAGDPAGVVLHSVPPLVVFVAAEAISELQDKLTECVHRAHASALARAQRTPTAERDTARSTAAPDTTGHPADSDRWRGDPVAAQHSPHSPADAAAGGVTPPAAGASGRPAAVATTVTGPRPRSTTANATAARAGTRTGATTGRGRRATPELAVLVAHARPILDRYPGLGRRELANRLGEALAVDVAPYWAAKAKAEIDHHPQAHAVAGGGQ